MTPTDSRPRTAVLHQFTGIGDLIWHVQYFKAVARQSQGGKVTVIAQRSTMATSLLAHEPWVEAIIDHDHRPRRQEARKAEHGGLLGMWRMARQLKALNFDRIVLFSGRTSRGVLAAMTGIPVRLGYGYRWLQRICLTQGPYIDAYRGPAVAVLKEVFAFSKAHGFCETPLIPRIDIPPQDVSMMTSRLEHLPRPAVALAIGSSETHKQWGGSNFATLAERLARLGHGVIILGGPSEASLARSIMNALPGALRPGVHCITDASVLGSAAALSLCDACIGNDTGMISMSAAVGRPTWVLLGPRPALDHDPLITSISSASLAAITVDDVMASFALKPGIGYAGPPPLIVQ